MKKRINSFIEQNIKIFIVSFLFLQPTLDIIAAVSINLIHTEITISSIVRLIFLFFSIYYVFFLDNTENKKRNKVFISIIMSYILVFAGVVFLYKGTGAFVYEIRNTLNTFYLPIILISFIDMFKQYKIKKYF